MKIKDVIKLLSLNNEIILIGSNANKKTKYQTDYDLQEEIKINNIYDYEIYYQKIKNIFKFVKNSNEIIITDMKSGNFNTLPIRWKYDEIIKGFKNIDIKKIKFVDTLQNENTTTKIDLIVFIDNIFIEFSCNYYFSTIFKEKHEILKSLLLDVKKYYHEEKYIKMIKRLMSYRMINNENNNDFEEFLNNDIGKLYQLNHNINVYLFIIDKYKNDFKSITTGIKKKQFKIYSDIAFNILSKNIKKILNLNINNYSLKSIIEILNDKLNKFAIDFINKKIII